MPAFTMPDIFRIKVEATCPTHSRTEARARQHTILIDEPPARGGSDLAATPLETLLTAYLGCTNVIANFVAEEMGMKVHGLTLSVVGHFDTRGVFAKADVRAPFPRIDLDVKIATDANSETVEQLRRAVARRCPISVILREAGSQIVENWTIIPAAGYPASADRS